MRHGHEVRIIGGQWKRSRLPVADRAGLRPTPDRVRETLFNWLGQDLQGWRCIDAFAGAGALGFEAASRGAAKVWMIERDASLVGSLKRVQERLSATSVQVEAGDGVAALQRTPPHSWDLIFRPTLRQRPLAQGLGGVPTRLGARRASLFGVRTSLARMLGSAGTRAGTRAGTCRGTSAGTMDFVATSQGRAGARSPVASGYTFK